MHWVLQTNLFNEENHGRLIRAVQAMRLPHSIVQVSRLLGAIDPPVDVDGPVVAFGTYTLVDYVKKRGWKPGVWDNEDFDYRVWSEKLAGHVLNEPVWIGPFGDAPFQEQPFFIRPCADTKAFTGHVVESCLGFGFDLGGALRAVEAVLKSPSLKDEDLRRIGYRQEKKRGGKRARQVRSDQRGD